MSGNIPPSQSNNSLVDAIIRSSQQAHSGFVLRSTELLREELLETIKIKVNPLNAAAVKQILSKYSPPSDFYTRIEVAEKLNILDNESYRILGILLEIRNEFSHPKNMCSLDKEPVLTLFRKLHTNSLYKGSYIKVFLNYVNYVNDVLVKHLVNSGVNVSIPEQHLPETGDET